MMRLVLLLAMLAGCQAKPVYYELMEVKYDDRPQANRTQNNGVIFRYGASDLQLGKRFASSCGARGRY
jgi:hypothetical protein